MRLGVGLNAPHRAEAGGLGWTLTRANSQPGPLVWGQLKEQTQWRKANQATAEDTAECMIQSRSICSSVVLCSCCVYARRQSHREFCLLNAPREAHSHIYDGLPKTTTALHIFKGHVGVEAALSHSIRHQQSRHHRAHGVHDCGVVRWLRLLLYGHTCHSDGTTCALAF